jgi:hypothetical protein
VHGRWRIKHRVVVRDWEISMPIEADSTVQAGRRSGADPAFAALGQLHGAAVSMRG